MVVNRAKNLKDGEEKSEIEVPKAWIPIAIADTIEEKYPKRIDVLGESFVVWRDPKAFNSTNKGWTVMRDYCPHRFAPLSEGRVDEKTGCLECPYHGWQFRSETGECTRIPQALSDEKKMTCTTQTTAKTFPVHLTSQIIWAYLPVSGLNQSVPDFPENLFPEINDAQRLTMVRDVPYSFDFTVENFMDPAHIPFAHHSLQGNRDDAIGIPMEILTNIDNQTHCEVSFQDRTRKRKREGIVSFISPIFYSLKLLNQESNEYHRPLYMFVVPVETARTRIFVSTKIPMSLLFKLFPTWFLHAATMKFINSDIWVYDQEKMIRNPLNRFWKNKSGYKLYNDALLGNRHIRHPHGNLNEGEEILPKYTLVTQSDRGCIAWRKWWKKHMSHSPIFGASTHVSDLTKTELLDHYEFHTKDCQHCQNALKRAKLLRKINPILSLAAIGFFKNIYLKLLGILSYILVEKYIEAVEKGTLGPDRFEKTTAAQFD